MGDEWLEFGNQGWGVRVLVLGLEDHGLGSIVLGMRIGLGDRGPELGSSG